jgi:homoserine/homoserine lactone efflux protein
MIYHTVYMAFVGACVILGLIPGPNIALIVANSIAHGTRYGLASVAGTSSAMVPQLAITVLGATTLLTLMSSAFEWLRWVGVAYLLYLGIRHWFADSEAALQLTADKRATAYKTVYWRGFLVSATNPKTLLFFGAFLPQFVTTQENIALQMTVLSATFLAVITVVDSCWAILAGRVRGFLLEFSRLRHRISGAFFIMAGVGLALAKKP